ncbi:MAG: rod shape-determining protein MreD [Bacteroidaceae bacterium]|nr:rod shape-determining protein MreD [Bacteroidaceae bacterium]
MSVLTLKRLRLFIVLVLVQALVLNFVQLFGCAMPLLYIYFLIELPRGTERWKLYLWGFFLGLSVDTFLNTPGVAAISCTTIAALRPYILEPFLTVDASAEFVPTIRQMGAGKYFSYVGMYTAFYCIIFFTIDYFTFWHLGPWLLSIITSYLLTMLTIASVAIAFQKR